jgi:hypothetical protein
MNKNQPYSNAAILKLLDDLEQMQHYLLMVKAAALAFHGEFNENCPYVGAESPFSREETANYFTCQFLELNPDAKLEQVMRILREFEHQVETQPKQRQNQRTDKASINISIENLDLGNLS